MNQPPKDCRYLVTGAAGFIGSHLGNRLFQLGNRVYGLDNYLHPVGAPPLFKIERADVRDFEYLAISAKNADAIIHLAAAINIDWGQTFPELAWQINVDGTRNVLEVARRFDIPVIYASSSEVYGTAQATAMSETHPLDGQSIYSASKIAGDRLCRAYVLEHEMQINVVRLFNTMGYYQGDDSYGGVIAKFTRQALENKPMTIYGSCEQRRDYLWIDDAVNAYLLALTTRFPGPINFGTGTTVSVLDIARGVAELCGLSPSGPKTLWEHDKPRRGEVDCLRADWSKAKALGWEPKTSFANGLYNYIEWAKRQRQI